MSQGHRSIVVLASLFLLTFCLTYASAHTDTKSFSDADNCDLGPGGNTEGHEHRDEWHMLGGRDCAQLHDGNDLIEGGAGEDFNLDGGQGPDRMEGQFGDDNLYGKEAADDLIGDEAADYTVGQAGDDVMHGNDGYDFLNGVNDDAGDVLYGGDGHDTCQVDKNNGDVIDEHHDCEELIEI